MPRMATGTAATLAWRAARLPAGHPLRVAARDYVDAARAQSHTVAELAAALGCSRRHAQRLLAAYDLPRWPGGAPQTEPDGPPHPPQRWCSCEWCLRARGRAA